MSLNLTYIVASKKEMPKEKIYNSIISNGEKKANFERVTPLIKANIQTITRLIIKLIKAFRDIEITIILVGKLNFLIKSPRPTIDDIDRFVVSLKKPHNTVPNNSATEKCGTSAPNFRNLTNTMYITANNISGFKTDHT